MSKLAELQRLAQLRASGALSAKDFLAAREALLEDVDDAVEAETAPPPQTATEEPDMAAFAWRALGASAAVALVTLLIPGTTLTLAGACGVLTLGAFTWALFKQSET